MNQSPFQSPMINYYDNLNSNHFSFSNFSNKDNYDIVFQLECLFKDQHDDELKKKNIKKKLNFEPQIKKQKKQYKWNQKEKKIFKKYFNQKNQQINEKDFFNKVSQQICSKNEFQCKKYYQEEFDQESNYSQDSQLSTSVKQNNLNFNLQNLKINYQNFYLNSDEFENQNNKQLIIFDLDNKDHCLQIIDQMNILALKLDKLNSIS